MSDINPRMTPQIWSEILKLLPVKTLGQCMCVCKTWESLIKSSSFVAAHLQNSAQSEANSCLLYRQYSNAPEHQEQYIVYLDSAQKESVPKPLYTFTCPFISHKYFRVVGSVHGLICLSDDLFGYSYLVILWNPLLNKYIKLPVPEFTYATTGSHISAFGFGYDSKKGCHKVVRVTYMRDEKALDTTPPRAQLYSVQEGRWRKVVSANSVVNICICDYWWTQCFLNRAVHWVAWERDAKTRAFYRNCLLLFDVEQEKFKKMRLPETLSEENTMDLCVSNCGDKLSVIHSVRKGGTLGNEMERWDLWVKGEYGVGSSWCKMLCIEMNPSTNLRWVQCLRRNGDVLGFTKKGELVSYDPLVEKINRLGVRGCWRSWSTCSYTESLVLLDKKKSVGTYSAARGQRKQFDIQLIPNGCFELSEKDVDSKDVKHSPEESSYLANNREKALVLEQLRKFDAGRMTKDIPEFLAMAGLDFSDFQLMVKSYAAEYL